MNRLKDNYIVCRTYYTLCDTKQLEKNSNSGNVPEKNRQQENYPISFKWHRLQSGFELQAQFQFLSLLVYKIWK